MRWLLSLPLVAVLSSCGPSSDPATKADPEVSASVPAQDWPIFRRDAEMQGVSAEDLQTPLEIAWKFEPPVEGESRRFPISATAVIAAGKVYVGSQDQHLYCLDLATGELVWKFKSEGPIGAPAAIADGQVFVGDTYGFVYAIDAAEGTETWRFETNDKIEGGVNVTEIEGENRVFVGSHDYSLYCLAAATGEKIWEVETSNVIMSTPSLVTSTDEPAAIFGGCDGYLHVVSAIDGRELSQAEIGSYIANSAAVRDGVAYLAHYGGEVMAIDVENGETVWKSPPTNIEYQSSPAVTEDKVIIGGRDKANALAAYDRITGELLWAFPARRDIDGSPVVTPSAIWVGGQDARLYAISEETGEELWSYDLGTQLEASPAISGGKLVISGKDGVVYAFAEAE